MNRMALNSTIDLLHLLLKHVTQLITDPNIKIIDKIKKMRSYHFTVSFLLSMKYNKKGKKEMREEKKN